MLNLFVKSNNSLILSFKPFFLFIIFFIFSSVEAQENYLFEGFENKLTFGMNWTVIDIDSTNDIDGTPATWKINSNPYGKDIYTNSQLDITKGIGHSSFGGVYINNNSQNNDWLILNKKILVQQDYIFNVWMESNDNLNLESVRIMASKSNNKKDLLSYSIVLDSIVDIPGNVPYKMYDKSGNYTTVFRYGPKGQWKLYSFKLEDTPGIVIGDSIYIAFHYNSSFGKTLYIDEVSYDKYCLTPNSFGPEAIEEEPYTGGYFTPTVWFYINSVTCNEINGPFQNELTNKIAEDGYCNSYVYWNNQLNGTGKASMVQGQLLQLNFRAIHQSIIARANSRITAWIDFNQDGIFDNSEIIGTKTFAAKSFNYALSGFFNFLIPQDANLGDTRLRIRMQYDESGKNDVCEDLGGFGQVFDYQVNIIPSIESKFILFDDVKLPTLYLNPDLCVTNVSLHELNNNSHYKGFSECSDNTCKDTLKYGSNYSNYTHLPPASITEGKTYPLLVSARNPSVMPPGIPSGVTIGAWIDFNQNGNFTDINEKIGVIYTTNGLASFDITLPAGVTMNMQVVMRIRVVDGDQTNSLSATNVVAVSNETEDYRVILKEKPCTAPLISSQPENTEICAGANITFTVKADYATSYQWISMSQGDITGETNSTYTIKGIKTANEDLYSCKVINSCETDTTKPFILKVLKKPNISIMTISTTKYLGDSLVFSLSADGAKPIKYEWYKDSVLLLPESNHIIINEGQLTIKNISKIDEGLYSCAISNLCGKIVADVAYLIVKDTNSYTVKGVIKYDNNALMFMSDTKVYLQTNEGFNIDSSSTSLKGEFSFKNVVIGSYKLNYKTAKQWGGSDALDALICKQHFTGIYTFNDILKEKAADVNGDNVINSIDALLISKRFINKVNDFPVGDWVFSIDNIVVNNNMVIEIQSICVGDTNGSY